MSTTVKVSVNGDFIAKIEVTNTDGSSDYHDVAGGEGTRVFELPPGGRITVVEQAIKKPEPAAGTEDQDEA